LKPISKFIFKSLVFSQFKTKCRKLGFNTPLICARENDYSWFILRRRLRVCFVCWRFGAQIPSR